MTTNRTSQEEAKELTAFHRSFWCQCDRKSAGCPCHSPITGSDVWLLLLQGYGLTDIGVMFGVSRERVRQIANKLDIPRTHGTKHRVWDESLGRFRAYERREWAEYQRLQKKAKRRRLYRDRRERERGKQVDAVRALHKGLGRTPTVGEVARRCGTQTMRLYVAWGYNARRPSVTPKVASRALYAAAGLKPRPPGTGGQLVQPWPRSIDAETVRALWLAKHPYTEGRKRGVNPGVVYGVIHRKSYKDITETLPPLGIERPSKELG